MNWQGSSRHLLRYLKMTGTETATRMHLEHLCSSRQYHGVALICLLSSYCFSWFSSRLSLSIHTHDPTSPPPPHHPTHPTHPIHPPPQYVKGQPGFGADPATISSAVADLKAALIRFEMTRNASRRTTPGGQNPATMIVDIVNCSNLSRSRSREGGDKVSDV